MSILLDVVLNDDELEMTVPSSGHSSICFLMGIVSRRQEYDILFRLNARFYISKYRKEKILPINILATSSRFSSNE